MKPAQSLLVDAVAASLPDGDHLNGVRVVFIWAKAVDDTVTLRALAWHVEAEPPAPFKVAGDPSGPERFAGPAPAGQVADRMEGGVDERLVCLCQAPQVIEHLRQEAAVPGLRHRSAVASRDAVQRHSDLVEVEPGLPGLDQASTCFGCVERVLHRRGQLHP